MKYFPLRLINLALLLAFSYPEFAHADLAPQVGGETPASLACIYGLTTAVRGCPIDGTTAVPTGGSGAIAIIDGQDDPNAFAELTLFSNQFTGLKVLNECNSGHSNQPCFKQYYVRHPFNSSSPCVVANNDASNYNIKPANDVEPELDIEWAHAMAPHASIYMVETQGWGDDSNPADPDITSLVRGVQCATHLLQTYNNGGIISYSHSFAEWAGETTYDSNFQTPGIIYIASSGDYSKPARYPATSPYVIAAGGTSIRRDSAGNYIDQIAWDDTNPNDCTNGVCKTGGSGGPSLYESRPSYQNSVQKIVGSQRGTPDFSFAAENIDVFCCEYSTVGPPATNNNCCGTGSRPTCQSVSQCASGQGVWVTTGGTSLASPALAGIINSARSGATTTAEELSTVYNGAIKNYAKYWTDVIYGNNGYPALRGYDFTTGLGVPRGYSGK